MLGGFEGAWLEWGIGIVECTRVLKVYAGLGMDFFVSSDLFFGIF